MMRKINEIIVHCSDSDKPEHDSLEEIKKWHLIRGFNDIGYHFVITKNGTIRKGRALSLKGAHVKGHNENSIGICLTGRNDFSPDQFFALAWLIYELVQEYPTIKQVSPHNKYDKNKTCPNFSLSIFDFKMK